MTARPAPPRAPAWPSSSTPPSARRDGSAGWLVEEGCRLEVFRCYAGDGLPASPGDYDALVVLGGEMGACDDAAAPLAARAPGRCWPRPPAPAPRRWRICLGLQLLAVGTGGRVEPAGQPQLGVRPLEPEPAAAADPLLGAVPAGAPAVHWNQRPGRRGAAGCRGPRPVRRHRLGAAAGPGELGRAVPPGGGPRRAAAVGRRGRGGRACSTPGSPRSGWPPSSGSTTSWCAPGGPSPRASRPWSATTPPRRSRDLRPEAEDLRRVGLCRRHSVGFPAPTGSGASPTRSGMTSADRTRRHWRRLLLGRLR